MSEIYQRGVCPKCHQKLEYPNELAGEVINCPNCTERMTLPAAAPIGAAPPRAFSKRIKDAGRAALDKSKLKELLLESVHDGVLTVGELNEIRALMARTGVDKSVLAEWSPDIMARAVDSITLINLSMERIESVEGVRAFLGVRPADVPQQTESLSRWRTIAEIRDGALPVRDAQNVTLQEGETIHWVEPAKVWEERVVSGPYEGDVDGTSFRIKKGVTFRTDPTRGHLVNEMTDVPISEGDFIITSKRIIFQGKTESFETKFENIVDIQNHLDGIRYKESNQPKPRKIQYHSANGDITVEILNQLVARRKTNK